jgi:hypothetical protein
MLQAKMYAENLHVQLDLVGGVHPLIVTELAVYPTGHPEKRRLVEVARETPLPRREDASVVFWWPFS